MEAKHEVLVSSRNLGKLAEFEAILADLELHVVSASERGVPHVEETGVTLAENALLKAAAAYQVSEEICIADDSGLFVDALDGAPGVYSARFAGEDVTYEDNNRELLRRLEGIPESRRGAAFVSVMALLVPKVMLRDAGQESPDPIDGLQAPEGAALFIVEGRIQGRIMTQAVGTDGFGYDPVFFVISANKTFAEMDASQKNTISHRARALAGLRELLQALRLNG